MTKLSVRPPKQHLPRAFVQRQTVLPKKSVQQPGISAWEISEITVVGFGDHVGR
ncbi:MAG TPA: hypothetical protein VE964_04480 [Myxococcales bacterium]|nr:hypothetical protein [Myxococcales bacterium]